MGLTPGMQGPNKSGGWSSTVPMTTGDSSARAPVQANMPVAGYKTIQFGVVPPAAPANDGVFAAVATISWMVEGNRLQRKVSVGNGVSISAPGEAFNVTIQDTTPTSGGLQVLGSDYVVTVNFAPGSRPSQNQPATLFGGTFTIAALGNLVLDVPANAGVISVEVIALDLGGTNLGAKIVVEQKVSNVSAVILKAYVIQDAYEGFVSLPGQATKLSLSNINGADAALVSVTWGIDG